MFKDISFCKFLEYYSIMIHNKFHSILQKNGQEQWYRNMTQKCIMEKTHLKFSFFLYKQCKHHSKNAFSVYKCKFWKHVIYVWILLSFLYMEMSTTQNSLKKEIPLNLDQPPPQGILNKCTLSI